MANITVTVPDAAVDRIKAAFGVSTNAQMQAKIKDFIRQVVIEREAEVARQTSRDNLVTEVNTW